jgi:hypothetical protein
MKDVNKLKQSELQAVVRLLGHKPGKNKLAENKALIRTILETPAGGSETAPVSPAATHPAGPSAEAVESGVRLMESLRGAKSIDELRAGFAPLREQPKAVLEEVARRLGYEFSGSKEGVADQLLQTLERMCISQMRGEIIKGAAPAQDAATAGP